MRSLPHTTSVQDFFCRLCASEGVLIHPLFPPGDNDPKDELVRMIEVLTSVHLTRADDAGAVICDKCLQILDLFCKFREECLRQDVLIRTRRTLLAEALLEGQRQQLIQEQQQQQQQQEELTFQHSIVEVKHEDTGENIQPVIAEVPEEIVCTPSQLIAPDDCKAEGNEAEKMQQFLVTNSSPVQPETGPHQYDAMTPLLSSNAYNNSFPVPYPATCTATVSHTTDGGPQTVSQDERTGHNGLTTTRSARHGRAGRRAKRKPKPNFKKPPPGCDRCPGESFATYYEYDQHMNKRHAWDKSNRSSLACDPCQMRFTKSYNLKRHMYEVHRELPHGLTVIPCEHCGELFLRGNMLERHIVKVHRGTPLP